MARQMTAEDRRRIDFLLQPGWTPAQTAEDRGRSKSTILHETINRSVPCDRGYRRSNRICALFDACPRIKGYGRDAKRSFNCPHDEAPLRRGRGAVEQGEPPARLARGRPPGRGGAHAGRRQPRRRPRRELHARSLPKARSGGGRLEHCAIIPPGRAKKRQSERVARVDAPESEPAAPSTPQCRNIETQSMSPRQQFGCVYLRNGAFSFALYFFLQKSAGRPADASGRPESNGV